MEHNYWNLIRVVYGYHVWQGLDGYYQVTKTNTPPTNTAGYKNLDSMLSIKGLVGGYHDH